MIRSSRWLTTQGTAMLCVASDAPVSRRVGLVSSHAYSSGAIAAELLSFKLFRKTHVATITGELTTLDHAEKLRGCAATLEILATLYERPFTQGKVAFESFVNYLLEDHTHRVPLD